MRLLFLFLIAGAVMLYIQSFWDLVSHDKKYPIRNNNEEPPSIPNLLSNVIVPLVPNPHPHDDEQHMQEQDNTARQIEQDIIQNEILWAEHSLEGYKRKKDQLPLRSTIRARHIHSEDWIAESITLLGGTKEPKTKSTRTMQQSSPPPLSDQTNHRLRRNMI